MTLVVDWPDFALGEAINQVIAAGGAILGVFVGARMALRQARWQITTQRAFERRADWLERTVVLVRKFERPLEDMFGITRFAPADDPDAVTPEVVDRHARELLRHLDLADVYLDQQGAADVPRFVARTEALNDRWRRLIDVQERARREREWHLKNHREPPAWDSDAWMAKVSDLERDFVTHVAEFRQVAVAWTRDLLGFSAADVTMRLSPGSAPRQPPGES